LDAPILILIPSVLAFYFGLRYVRLRRGVRELAESLTSSADDLNLKLSPSAAQGDLSPLRRAVVNTVSESSLVRDSERRQREFQEALLNEIKDAIFILDRNREIRFLNHAAKLLFPSDQPYKARAFLDVCRDHRVVDTLTLAEEIGAKVSDSIALRVHSDGKKGFREVSLLVEAEPLSFGGSEENTGAWILMKDISRQLETEQIRRDFVANASHELRTPLSIINGYLETMDDSDVDLREALYRRAIRTMRKHGERIARIVDDMLTISKLESAADLLKCEAFDLRDSVEEMVGQLMPIIEQNHARVRIETESESEWILIGDRFYWDQIFFNLIENALKENPEPGLKVSVTFRSEGGRYLVSIADDGIGIPAADLPLIFKRFYRVQKHHAQSQVKGTGLGLSIVKRAVEAHHGKIEVESQPGVKTVFTISVPAPPSKMSDRPLGKESRDELAG
jgi:two-component system, OmpR family, phosphate regulon sensor histidine kinase PhoR